MAVNILKRLRYLGQLRTLNKPISRRFSIYEPDYLEALKPKYPLYPPLLVRLRGYDFPILEKYQSYVHKVANLMDFDIEDSYAVPARELKILKYKPKSTVIETEYFLRVHERDIKICDVPSVRLKIFIRAIQKAIPPGVMLDIEEWSYDKEKTRFIPDKELLDLKGELEEMQKPKK
ncbi:large ribosomal subunit protein mL48 [Phymastichus coffea]|uniref:large ribosomal subunit protein mL48 n=1 Tax=Phymastichus coffea TaxID=108790 RepID=UPI00273B6D86|nr:large ribosomal subunit protein mL48 [Phymastichus coffea]